MKTPQLLAVMGPTASGKSAIAEALADRIGARLVSADAFQVYRGFDIGTAKSARRSEYAMVDVADPTEQFGVGAFVAGAREAIEAAWQAQSSVIVVGGTGLFVRALFEGYHTMHAPPDASLRASLAQEEAAEPGTLLRRLLELDPDTPVDRANPARVQRALERQLDPRPIAAIALPPFVRTKFALEVGREQLGEAIHERAAAMVRNGWAEEVREILDAGVEKTAPAFRAIGYQSVVRFLAGESTEPELVVAVSNLTRQYAKRQVSWLRREPGLEVRRIDLRDDSRRDRMLEDIAATLADRERPDGLKNG